MSHGNVCPKRQGCFKRNKTHTSNLEFQLTQLSQWEKGGGTARWKGPETCRCFKKVVSVCRKRTVAVSLDCEGAQRRCGCKSAVGERFRGLSCKDHENKPEENWCHSLQSRQVRWDDQSQYHQEIESVFVGGRLSFLLLPPACVKVVG